jgi:hypothetical protein
MSALILGSKSGLLPSMAILSTHRDEVVDAVQHENGLPDLQSVRVLVNDVRRSPLAIRRGGESQNFRARLCGVLAHA